MDDRVRIETTIPPLASSDLAMVMAKSRENRLAFAIWRSSELTRVDRFRAPAAGEAQSAVSKCPAPNPYRYYGPVLMAI